MNIKVEYHPNRGRWSHSWAWKKCLVTVLILLMVAYFGSFFIFRVRYRATTVHSEGGSRPVTHTGYYFAFQNDREVVWNNKPSKFLFAFYRPIWEEMLRGIDAREMKSIDDFTSLGMVRERYYFDDWDVFDVPLESPSPEAALVRPSM